MKCQYPYWEIIKAAAAAEVFIYGGIGKDFFGEGVGSKQIAEDLKALGNVSKINVRINSPGGNVFEGTTIYNLLVSHQARIEVYVDGIAASVASLIAMAGDNVHMPENTMMMIHDPSGLVVGNARDMRDLADVLDKIKKGMIRAYKNKTGLPEQKLDELLSDETWMTADEAKELGFADEVVPAQQIAACADIVSHGIGCLVMSHFQRAPAALTAAAFSGRSPMNITNFSDIERQDPETVVSWANSAWESGHPLTREFTAKEHFVYYCKNLAMGRVHHTRSNVQRGP